MTKLNDYKTQKSNNKRFLPVIISLFFLITLSFIAKSQEKIHTRQLWLSAAVQYNINNNIQIAFAQGLRFWETTSDASQHLTDVGGYYIFSDKFKIGVFYRFRQFFNINEHQNEFYTNFINTINFVNLSIENRLRLHLKFFEQIESINNLRYRFLLKYKSFEHFKPYAYAEIFYLFNSAKGNKLSWGRYAAGIEFPINMHNKIDFFFIYETSYNFAVTFTAKIFGLYYSYTF